MSGPSSATRALAAAMPGRWRAPNSPVLLDMSDGVCAALLDASSGEVANPASSTNIISLILAGERNHRFWHDGRSVIEGHLPTGGINIVPAGIAPRAVVSNRLRVLHLYVPAAALIKTAEAYDLPSQGLELRAPLCASDPSLAALLRELSMTFGEAGAASRLWRDGLSMAVRARLLHQWSNLSPRTGSSHGGGGLAPWQLARVCDRMTGDVTDEPSLDELAALIGVSPEHLCRSFRRSTGFSPHRWLARRRIELAREILGSCDGVSIADIAAAVGYDDPSYFARVFKRATGATPLAFRRERRR